MLTFDEGAVGRTHMPDSFASTHVPSAARSPPGMRAAIARYARRIDGFGLSVVMFAAVWVALSSPWLSGRVTIPYDAKAHFQAQLDFLAHALHSGQSPFWQPYTFAGSPQIADPQSLIFSPAALIALVDAHPSFRALDAYVLALLGVAGLAVMLLFRDRGWHPAGGLVAAIAIAFGASAAWRIQHIGQIKSYALIWVALLFLSRALALSAPGADRGARRRALGNGVAAGLTAGLMMAEPDQVGLLGCTFLAAVIATHWLATGPRAARGPLIRATLPPLAVATLAGALVVTVPLVLTMLFVADSNRPAIAYTEAVRGSLHPVSLLTLLVGDLFGALDPHVDYWGPFSESWDPEELTLAQNMSQLYLGALPILLVLGLGLARGLAWTREVRLVGGAAMFFLLYAVGHHTPVFALLYHLAPGVQLFRRPADATFLLGGTLAILAGYLLHRLLTDASASRPLAGVRRLLPLGLPIAGLAAAVGVAVAQHHLADAWRPLLMAIGWLGLSAAAVHLLPRLQAAAPRLAIALPAVLLAADLAANNGPNESTALPPAGYAMLEPDSRNETVRLLKSLVAQPPGSPRRDRVELTGLGFEWPNAAMVQGLDHLLGYNPLRLELVTAAVGATDTVAGPDQRQFTPLFPSYASRLADLVGLRYIATSVPVETIDAHLMPGDLRFIARTPDAYVYENPRALPRVLFAASARRADFATILRTGTWPSFDPAETVLLEDAPGEPSSTASPAAAHAHVGLNRYENTRIVVGVDAPRPGYVVLNDIWHPWWRATVDGIETPILRANVLFRAVAVPAGRHDVVFEFRPFAGALAQLGGRLGWLGAPPR